MTNLNYNNIVTFTSTHKKILRMDGICKQKVIAYKNNTIAMALAKNLEDLLNKQKIESNRFEFKKKQG